VQKVLVLAALLIFAAWGKANADYSFSFMSTNGTYGVQGILDTSPNGDGSFTVTGGSVTGDGTANNGVSYSLATLSQGNRFSPWDQYSSNPGNGAPAYSFRVAGGTDLGFDNQLYPGSNPVLDRLGLVFYNPSFGMNFSYDPGYSSVTVSLFNGGNLYNVELAGNVALTPEVTTTPIPGAVWLFGSGLFGLIGVKRRYLG
jgi:hypothetical protein